MLTICAHIAGYNYYVHQGIKLGQQTELSFWMLTDKQPATREVGEQYLTNTGASEYEFGGTITAEIAINETIVLIIDTGSLQFYTSGGPVTDANKNASRVGKFARGKGNLSFGEYPYNMGVKKYTGIVKQITRVTIPGNDRASSPMYLSPGLYTAADTSVVENLNDVSDPRDAFYLIDIELGGGQ